MVAVYLTEQYLPDTLHFYASVSRGSALSAADGNARTAARSLCAHPLDTDAKPTTTATLVLTLVDLLLQQPGHKLPDLYPSTQQLTLV